MNNNFDYSVRVKNGAGWRKYNRIRLMVSVGKEYHEGQKLAAVVNWINRNQEIQEVHISVNDLLQRHNHEAAGLSKEKARLVALAEGSQWLARNQGILDEIKTKKFFTRWHDWFDQPNFKIVQRKLLSHTKIDLAFGASMMQDANSLAQRKIKRGEPVPSSLVAHSQDYIEEEMAIFAMQTAALPAAEVYPGSNLIAAEYFLHLSAEQSEALPEEIRPLVQRYFTRIDFDRINVERAHSSKEYLQQIVA